MNSKFEKVELTRPLQLILPFEIINKNCSKNDADNIRRQGVSTHENLKNDSAATRQRRVGARNADIIRRLTANSL